MKRFNLKLAAPALFMGCLLSSSSSADVLEVPGVVTEVVDRVRGSAVTILDFDIPRLRQGEGLEIVSATIDWDHAAITEQKTVRYQVFDSPFRILGGLQTPSLRTTLDEVLEGEPSSTGVLYPQDFRRTGKGHLTLDVQLQVRAAIDLNGDHIQVLVATDDMSPELLSAGATAVPTLIIRYGFLGGMKSVLGRRD